MSHQSQTVAVNQIRALQSEHLILFIFQAVALHRDQANQDLLFKNLVHYLHNQHQIQGLDSTSAHSNLCYFQSIQLQQQQVSKQHCFKYSLALTLPLPSSYFCDAFLIFSFYFYLVPGRATHQRIGQRLIIFKMLGLSNHRTFYAKSVPCLSQFYELYRPKNFPYMQSQMTSIERVF